ncbi:MAG: amidohydrolase family protein [Bdellovibrionaceae bacterium]|nr:amidohydrolase family protein [Pseudobdellovibrionaceae bacterium]
MNVVLRNGLIVTMNRARDVFRGEVHIVNEHIAYVGKAQKPAPPGALVIDATHMFVLPGLIQAHVHLCQALFRGDADDMKLLDWLKKRIWPMESAHTPASLRASARIGLLEMAKSGTTAVLDMGTVHHTQHQLEAVAESGMRYWGGKCLMDLKSSSGPLYEKTSEALRETEDLMREWKGKHALVRYALCPRFAVSCTEGLLEAMVDLQEREQAVIHTHASESKDEIALIKQRTGRNNVDYFAHLGMLNDKTVIAHGVHLTKGELKKMVRAGTPLVHCPSSNLKLASGIAPIKTYVEAGLKVALGADGAPCNNSMDPFIEMRLTALLQKPKFGPDAMPAQMALELATVGGARALGAEDRLGSLEVGKLADVITIDRSHPSVATVENPYSAIVYSCLGRDVRDVFVHGRAVVRNCEHQLWDEHEVIANAQRERSSLMKRI